MSFRILMLLVLMAGAGAAAPAPACDGDKVKVTLVVILASEEGSKIDHRLKAIAAEVQKLNPNLKSFRLKEMTTQSMDPDEKATFPVVEAKVAHVVVRSGADKDNRVVLAVTAPDQGEIVYRAVCGKFLPIVTRCCTGPADARMRQRLILALRVEPCQGDDD
jgi:hypothetical protein